MSSLTSKTLTTNIILVIQIGNLKNICRDLYRKVFLKSYIFLDFYTYTEYYNRN
jgi:hypothetical protein